MVMTFNVIPVPGVISDGILSVLLGSSPVFGVTLADGSVDPIYDGSRDSLTPSSFTYGEMLDEFCNIFIDVVDRCGACDDPESAIVQCASSEQHWRRQSDLVTAVVHRFQVGRIGL